jgi:hypothetical protein
LKGVLSANHCFLGAERMFLFQIGLLSRVDEIHVPLVEPHVWKQQYLAQGIAVIIQIVFIGIPRENQNFQGGERFILFQIVQFRYIEETNTPLDKNHSVRRRIT